MFSSELKKLLLLMLLVCMIAVAGQTEARATTVMDHYSPFDQGFRPEKQCHSGTEQRSRQPLNSDTLHRFSRRHDLHQGNKTSIIITHETKYINKWFHVLFYSLIWFNHNILANRDGKSEKKQISKYKSLSQWSEAFVINRDKLI